MHLDDDDDYEANTKKVSDYGISKVLPRLEKNKKKAVTERLTELGVQNETHLLWVQESDFVGILDEVAAGKLIASWKSKNRYSGSLLDMHFTWFKTTILL